MKKQILLQLVTFILFACNSPKPDDKSAEAGKDATAATTDTVSVGIERTTDASSFLYGIDISKYQGDEIDFLTRKKDTLSFVICRATMGITGIDPKFKNNWNHIKSKGFTRGAYHFYYSNDAPVTQAKHFSSIVGTFSAGDFPPLIDVEQASIAKGQTVETVSKNLLQFINQVQTLTGRKPIIYTSPSIGNKYLSDPAFADYPLWIAHYSNKEPAILPGAWKGKKWILWQKSEKYVIESKTDDFDAFNGGAGELKNFTSSH